MTFERFREYCLAKPGVTEEYPFHGTAVWLKVMGKVFTIANMDEMKVAGEMVPPFHFINLKCDPEWAIDLRERHPAITPAWHMNKQHWNSIYTDGSLKDTFIFELIDHSYKLVADSLSTKVKTELATLSH
jgi:predicted DNA-binding protein (MmcQ/YjbR family)